MCSDVYGYRRPTSRECVRAMYLHMEQTRLKIFSSWIPWTVSQRDASEHACC